MPTARPVVAGVHRLDADEAGSVWQWLLHRQGLRSGKQFTSAAAVADATLGLHAARLPSPYATVLARAADPDVALGLWAEPTHRELVTLRCMRKTLHALPLALAEAAHVATLHYRERDVLRSILNAGVSGRLITSLTTRIGDLLGEHDYLTHRQIEARLVDGGTEVHAVRLALKLAWERGSVTYRNRSGVWNRELRTFALTAGAHPTLGGSLDRDAATERLVEAYFDRYGPASLRDVTWWSGLGQATVVSALGRLDRPLTAMLTPWSPAPLYLFQDRFEEFTRRGTVPSPTQVHFLAHEDVALKAYAETRIRYLGAVPEQAAFNQIGEALPAILLTGRVVGTWSWDVRRRAVRCVYHRAGTQPLDRAAVRAAATHVTEGLRRGYDDRRVNRTDAFEVPELIASATP